MTVHLIRELVREDGVYYFSNNGFFVLLSNSSRYVSDINVETACEHILPKVGTKLLNLDTARFLNHMRCTQVSS
jgi:hypothetical protein